MIELSHVTMHYRNGASAALSDISMTIRKGEFVFLTGPSGAGKTTLLKLLYGGERPTRGLVLVDGSNVARMPHREIAPFRRKLGVVFQDFKLLEQQTVFDNLALVIDAAGGPYRAGVMKIQSTLVRLGIQRLIKETVGNLSGGEQQRVAIARALVNDPYLLLADEPTGNLDGEATERVLRVFEDANLQGTTVVFATHNLGLIRSRRFRQIHLVGGRLVKNLQAASF